MMRILIVDDMPDVRRELTMWLELSGRLEIAAEARNGVEAIQKAEELQPDVIVMDLEMPVMDGYKAALKIKTLYPHSRIIALSVHDNAAARQRARDAGMEEFVVKGARFDSILQAIMNERSE